MKTAAPGKSGGLRKSPALTFHAAAEVLPRPQLVRTPEELAILAQAGSVEAFSQLVRRFEGRLFNYLLRRLPAHEAEDLTQETFIRAWQRIHLYQPRWKFSTWLFTIATRQTASHVRTRRPAMAIADQGPVTRCEPTAGLAAGETRSSIWLLVDQVLTAEQRTAVWLRYVEGLSMPEIAEVMGKSRVGIRVMLHRARTTLAGRIELDGDRIAILPQKNDEGELP